MATATVTGSVDGTNGVFTLSTALANPNIYVDRLHQRSTDYTLVGTVLTFLAGSIPQPNVPGTPDLASLHIDASGDPVGITSPSTPTTSKTGFATAGTIINRVAVQVGLASVADPFASTDPNFIQLIEFLNLAAEDLRNKHDWAHFITEATIVTANAALSYPLPADFYRQLDQTHWNRTTRFSMIGPLSGQETQYLKARLSGVLTQVAYRIQGNMITFAIAPSNGHTLVFEYVSANWVWSNAGTAPDSTAVVNKGDTVLYDTDLAIAGTRLLFLDAKGFDTTTAKQRYDELIDASIYRNVGARMLNMGGNAVNAGHLIDNSNLPITGYGN